MSSNTNYCEKINLLKLLYFLDFKHFRQTGKSVTGLDYYAWEMGPVPKRLYDEIPDKMNHDMRRAISVFKTNANFIKVSAKGKFDGRYFSKKELKLLEEIAFIFKDAKSENMVESTHLFNEPWDTTIKCKGLYQNIDYMLAIDSDPSSISYDEANERKAERNEMFHIFGVK